MICLVIVDVSGCRNNSYEGLVGLLKGDGLSNLLNEKSSLPKNIDLVLKVWQTVWGVVAVGVVGAENDGRVVVVRDGAIDWGLGSSAGQSHQDEGKDKPKNVHLYLEGCDWEKKIKRVFIIL